MKKIKYIIGIIILIVITSITLVYADYLYESNNVFYNNSNSTLNASDVQGAIDELYSKVGELNANIEECPDGYEKTIEDAYEFTCTKVNKPIICKRASLLHTEICNSDTSSTSYYCRGAGYSAGATITYGQLGTSGTLTSGDAFDCDVNGDGVYDSDTERFYYVSRYYDTDTQSFDNDYCVFIYNGNTYGGIIDTNHTISWYSSGGTSNGPETAILELPSTSGENTWRSDLLKTKKRSILNNSGTLIISNFSYEGYAARLLTIQEAESGCSNASRTAKSMKNCQYFFENSKFSDNNNKNWGFWLETVSSSSYSISSYYISEDLWNTYTNSFNGVRPVIEIHKDYVSY